MSVLVVGGNGFLGSSLVEALRLHGRQVRVLDPSSPRGDIDWSGIDYREAGLADAGDIAEALEGVDLVYHLASTTVPGTSNRDPCFDVGSNLVGSLRLFHAMIGAGVRRIVFFSSGGTVYGNPARVPVDEQQPLQPISSYGVVKVAIENYLGMYRQLGQLDPLILRPSNPYGPRQSLHGAQGAVAAFLGRALRDEGVSIWGDGNVVRDYIHIDDLTEFAVRAGISGKTGVFNAGSGTGHSLNELLGHVRRITGRSLPVEYMPGRAFDVDRIVLDIESARQAFGWSPRVSLGDGLDATWRALQLR